MYVKQVTIRDIGGIDNLDISLNPKMNIICGPNGIGKTTILECIAQGFAGNYCTILKKRANTDNGRVSLSFDNSPDKISFEVSSFSPEKSEYQQAKPAISRYLLSLKVARTFNYSALNSVSRDTLKDDNHVSNENKSGLNLGEVKNWFVNRYLYSVHAKALSIEQLHNFKIAKSFFGILNSDFSFSHVDAKTNEIMVSTPAGDIYYEYLSSGFKSCLSILFGIVKELEFRFNCPDIKIDEFDGIVLIDELELHLHPEWQAKLPRILTEAFPKIQFITTTHSPHIIQEANPKEVIALEATQGHIFKREISSTKYGFQGWTVEEVLKDVMGMRDTRTYAYHQALKQFEDAVDKENFEDASIAYNELDLLLHPENHLRKLLAFQLGALKG